jgi:hypothetical protein
MFWQSEQSGRMAKAVEAYLAERTGGPPVHPVNLALLAVYFHHWAHAPAWLNATDTDTRRQLNQLRERADELVELAQRNELTAAALADWTQNALELGIDPL